MRTLMRLTVFTVATLKVRFEYKKKTDTKRVAIIGNVAIKANVLGKHRTFVSIK